MGGVKVKGYTITIMKKIFVFILIVLVVGASYFLYINYGKNFVGVPLEERIYFAPNFYVSLPSVTGDTTVRFGDDRLTFDRGDDSFESIRVPEWTLLENKGRYTNYILARINIIPANEKFMYQAQESLGDVGEYEVFSQKTVINENVLSEEVVAQKTLKEMQDLAIKIEVPYKDESSQKFRSIEEAKLFISEVIENIEYDDTAFLGVAADRFAELESRIFNIFGWLDEDDVQEVRNWPPELLTTILYSELQQAPLNRVAQKTFDEEGTVENFCNSFYENAKEVRDIIPESLGCVSTERDLLLILELDKNATLCVNSRGFNGIVRSGSVSEGSVSCVKS